MTGTVSSLQSDGTKRFLPSGVGQACTVIDGGFDKDFIHLLFEYVMKELSFKFARINSINQERFSTLISLLGSKQIETNEQLSKLIRIAAGTISPKKNAKCVLRRCQVNIGLFGEVQYTHSDSSFDRTVVYFANPIWRPDWLGELLFYDDTDSDVVAAVTPKPGRMVAFESKMRHRGGTVSRLCDIPRVTLAFKFGVKD